MKAAAMDRLTECYPVINDIPESERTHILSGDAQLLSVPAGTRLFDEGSPCQGFPLVLSGSVRVARGTPGGRMLELYRVSPGELCVVSASCLFGRAPLSAHGQAVDATELALLSPAGFERLCQHEGFRRHVFGIFADRLADLMALTEAVAFQRLDQRLAAALLRHRGTLHVTHQQLADELGTVREIVSRLLSRFERAGWVSLGRERLQVQNADALSAVARGDVPMD